MGMPTDGRKENAMDIEEVGQVIIILMLKQQKSNVLQTRNVQQSRTSTVRESGIIDVVLAG